MYIMIKFFKIFKFFLVFIIVFMIYKLLWKFIDEYGDIMKFRVGKNWLVVFLNLLFLE